MRRKTSNYLNIWYIKCIKTRRYSSAMSPYKQSQSQTGFRLRSANFKPLLRLYFWIYIGALFNCLLNSGNVLILYIHPNSPFMSRLKLKTKIWPEQVVWLPDSDLIFWLGLVWKSAIKALWFIVYKYCNPLQMKLFTCFKLCQHF